MIKLNIGCGKTNFGPSWEHIDGANFPHIKWHDIIDLPYGDESVDLIYSSHTLEYFDRQEVVKVLKEWRRVLKPGGTLRLAVPDFQAMTKLYLEGNLERNIQFDIEDFLGPLYGKMSLGKKSIYHKTAYDYKSLRKLLESCGFKNIQSWDWTNTDHAPFDDCSRAYLPKMDFNRGTLISLNLECIKT
jgi:predicted SAM-dependent methyltransferase